MSKSMGEQSEYRSYLLRLWHTHSGGDPVWRASLEEPLTQQVVRFDSLPGLFDFLLTQTGQDGQGDGLDGAMPIAGMP